MYLHTKDEVSRSILSEVEHKQDTQTDTQTDKSKHTVIQRDTDELTAGHEVARL